jgi:hypothetical protein
VSTHRIEDLAMQMYVKVVRWLNRCASELPVGDVAKVTIVGRTPADQAVAFANGASRAQPGHSWHETTPPWALDFAIYRNSLYVTDGADPSYTLAGKIAIEEDLCWGGAWHKPDYDHVEDHPAGLGCKDAYRYSLGQHPPEIA